VAIATPDGRSIISVQSVSLTVAPGYTLALVGEGGSGKSTTGLALTGLLSSKAAVVGGAARLDGQELLREDEAKARARRGRDIAVIFQDPASSLNPVQRDGTQMEERLRLHDPGDAPPCDPWVIELPARVGIPEPERRARAWPHERSGGMHQRVMIAMAIANRPSVVIADEPTTALDVTIQAQILELLAELQRETCLALIFVTHNLPVVGEVADRVAVMYAGQIFETGMVAEVFAAPRHPYTRALLANGAPPPLVDTAMGWQSRCIRWKELV